MQNQLILKMEGTDIVPYAPGGKIPYITKIAILSNCGDLPVIKIDCVAADESLTIDPIPIYSITVNADFSKIDKDKLVNHIKNLFLIDEQ